MREVERRAQSYGLPPIRWPQPWPGDTLTAMRAATFAKQIGRTVAFSLAAFRQAFAAGRDLSEPDNVFVAAASSELHPRALETAIARDAIKLRLREATDRAADRGVIGVPAVVVAERVVLGRRSARGGGRGGGGASVSYVAVGLAERDCEDGASGRRSTSAAAASRPGHASRAARDDGADPALRGGGGAPVPAGQGRRLPPSGDRRGGDDRRHHLGDGARRLPDRDLPDPRPRDRPRHRSEERDGGALRPRRRHLRRARRLDARLRRRAPVHGRLRDRRRQPAAGRRARPRLRLQRHRRRHRLHVRRRRLEHRQLRRDDEPGGALAPAGRLHPREQPLRDGHRGRAPLGGHRLLEEGRGPRGAGRARRRHGRACDARDRSPSTSGSPARSAARPWSRPSPTATAATPPPTPRSTGPRRRSRSGARRIRSRSFADRLEAGGRALRATSATRCASGSRRGCSRRSSSPTSRPSRRSTPSTTTSTWSATRFRAGTRSTSARRTPFPGEREREAARGRGEAARRGRRGLRRPGRLATARERRARTATSARTARRADARRGRARSHRPRTTRASTRRTLA